MTTYLDGDKINYGRLLTDEVLAVDRLLVKAAKKNMDVAGKEVYSLSCIIIMQISIFDILKLNLFLFL